MENEAVLDRMQERLAKRPEVLNQRRETVEHPFGSIKQWMNQGAFLMRGLEKVRGEFSLTALAYNIRRVLNLVAFDKLMGELWRFARHRRGRWLNNRVEQDHRRIKRLTRPMLGFQGFWTAKRTLAGIEAMAMLAKGQVRAVPRDDMPAQRAFVQQIFGLAA